MDTLPSFLLIGAQKAGTTTLDAWLTQHPEIFLPEVKELNFFALGCEAPGWSGPGDKVAESLSEYQQEDYLKHYRRAAKGAVCGDSSVIYLYSPKAPEAILSINPEMKVIAVLRNPVERAYSAWQHLQRDGREKVGDFAKALEAESDRIAQNWEPLWHYLQVGFYGKQLKRYEAFFERDQILVLLNEDLRQDPAGSAKRIFSFLGVDDSFIPDTDIEMNASGIPKFQALNNFFTQPHIIKPALKKIVPLSLARKIKGRIQRRNLERLPPVSPEMRSHLISLYHDDICLTESLIDRDLSAWRATP